jgi:hypothetical protein
VAVVIKDRSKYKGKAAGFFSTLKETSFHTQSNHCNDFYGEDATYLSLELFKILPI